MIIQGGSARQQNIKESGATLIEYDWSAAGYDATVDVLGIQDDIAYGIGHDISSMMGTMAGYALLSFVPGAPIVGAIAEAGRSTEQALNSGASVDEAYAVGLGNASIALLSGYGLDEISDLAKNASSIKQIAGYMGLAALDKGIILSETGLVRDYYKKIINNERIKNDEYK